MMMRNLSLAGVIITASLEALLPVHLLGLTIAFATIHISQTIIFTWENN